MMWIEIFKTGKHTDSAGNEKTWTGEDLDQIVSKYDPSVSEAPVVIGHPEENAPAFGWVESLKRDGAVLLAKMKNLVPEFVDMVKKGLFKKRSISLYPDFSLRHVGFLGAVPPAVKGLADVQFRNAECGMQDYEFDAGGTAPAKLKGGEKMALKDLLKGLFAKTIDEIPEEQLRGDPPHQFSEAEVRAREDAAAKKAKDATVFEFAEKEKTRGAEIKAREDALRAKEAEARKTEIVSFVEGLKKQGKVLPAMEKIGAGITSFLVEISTSSQVMEFKEGEVMKKQTPLEFMKSFLDAIPKQIEFREVATRGMDIGGSGNAGEKLSALTRAEIEANKKLSYRDAFAEVQRKNPDLAREYLTEIEGGKK
jgi:hypothetical protein